MFILHLIASVKSYFRNWKKTHRGFYISFFSVLHYTCILSKALILEFMSVCRSQKDEERQLRSFIRKLQRIIMLDAIT